MTETAENPLKTTCSPLNPPAIGIENRTWSGLYGSSAGLALVEAAKHAAGPVIVLLANARRQQQLADEIHFYAAGSDLPIIHFPDWECLPYDAFSPHQDVTSRRLSALAGLPAQKQCIILTTVSAAIHRLAPREYVQAHSLLLRKGDSIDVNEFRQQLVRNGYQGVSQVMEPGEFAVRGGLIDLFPMGQTVPYRLDLFGDELETIRTFDPGSQRSGPALTQVELLPAREYPLNEHAINQFRQAFRARFSGDPQQTVIYRDVSQGVSPAGIEYYLPLFFQKTESLFDYLPDNTSWVLEPETVPGIRTFHDEVQDRYQQLSHDVERPILTPEEIFISPDAFLRDLNRYSRIELRPLLTDTGQQELATINPLVFETQVPPTLSVDHKSEQPYHALCNYLDKHPGRSLLVSASAGRRETLRHLLNEHGMHPPDVTNWQAFLDGDEKIGLAIADLEKGLELDTPRISVISETQLYGERASQRRHRSALSRSPDAIIRSLAELRIGDPVVHEEYGVGRYLGLQTLDVGDGKTEFLTLEYAGGDKLYIPVFALHFISRYTGTSPENAPLHRLGGDAWEKAKSRARQKAHDAAVEILELQALRAARKGHAFPVHDDHYLAFADAFPFEETPDQERAITEVISDMESSKPMDRLVCGDVGFGKTEVALRAAFMAIHGNKQVAVLVPTTLLAQQHYQNFADRFADSAVNVKLLSRFQSKSEQTAILKDLDEGKVDIVIGTHRLLQEDIRFSNLGLVIIDEEHRFGVRQKERLKKLRAEVDILTLTATPIPRTLNLSLSGMRDISIIATPPEERLAVKTFVLEWNSGMIREAILREIRRGGQVFYLHNEVRTMEKAVSQLHDLVPEAEIQMAHGQMAERELEHVMLDFYHQRFNVLVCSTIIESGIDIPTANTIVIERADKFGLAQLHQLRGRVGRSNHRAYAYLLTPPKRTMTNDARKRLEAIGSLDELGAGFVLASHDLEIRGAGELLGESQSGEIDEVGFTLYAELLNRAIESIKQGKDITVEKTAGAEVNVHAPALLPEDYLPDVHMRLILYKRIANAATSEELNELREEMTDRFGLLPDAAKLLFEVTELKIGASRLGIKKIDAGPKGARIDFVAQPNIEPTALIQLMQSQPKRFRLDGPNRLRVIQETAEPGERVQMLREIVAQLKPEH
jgi:transcription-repair coupling factor (superfamily II helicase)